MKFWHILLAALLPVLVPILGSLDTIGKVLPKVFDLVIVKPVDPAAVTPLKPGIVPKVPKKDPLERIADGTARVVTPLAYPDDEKHRWMSILTRVRTDPDSTRYFSNSQFDVADLAKFDRRIERYRVVNYAVIPESTEEFRRVFGFDPSITDLESLKNASAQFSAFAIETGFPKDQSELAKALTSTDSTVFTFSGHNVNGALVLSDGSTIDLGQIAESCIKYEKICVFLSCESDRFVSGAGVQTTGMRYALTLGQAAETLDQITRFIRFAAENEGTYKDVALAIPIIVMSYRVKEVAVQSLKYIGGGAGLGLIVVVNQRKG